MGGGSKTVQAPAPTAQELELQDLSVQVAQQQLEAINRQTAFQEQQFQALDPLLREQLQVSQDARARQLELKPIQDELLQLELDRIRQGPAATTEQKALIAASTEAAIASGESDITRFQEQGLQLLRSELSPSLGLRPSDSPILDRGGQIGAEASRQQGQLVSNLRGAQAQAELNFPLAAGQVASSQAQFQQGLASSASQFQSQLRQQAFQNRLAGPASVGGSNLALAGTPFGGFSAVSGNRSTTTSKGGSNIGSTLSGIGGLFTGGAALFALSNKSFKENFKKLNKKDLLEKTNKLDVSKWNYRWADADTQHIGPFAGEFQEQFELGDGVTINLMDAVGILFANVQQLTKELKDLKNAS